MVPLGSFSEFPSNEEKQKGQYTGKAGCIKKQTAIKPCHDLGHTDKIPFSKLVLFGIMAVYLLLAYFKYPGNVIQWDVFGYYLYLPFEFIYHDIEIKNEPRIWDIIHTYHNTETLYQLTKAPNGVFIMKYSMGLAFLYAPFFFAGHLCALAAGYPADGFSQPYQVSMLVCGLFYTFLGLVYLRKILLYFFDEKVTALTIILLVFGTNYLVHTGLYGQGLMSHNFLFTLYAMLIWYTMRFQQTASYVSAAVCGLLVGLIALCRPTEVISLLIPVLWNVTNLPSLKKKIRFIQNNLSKYLVLVSVAGAVGFVQLLYWKIHAGTFVFNSYNANAGEGFEFLHPYLPEVLFSFRKGWLIYTPLMLFAVITIFRSRSCPFFYPLVIYFAINLFIVSSWSCWWYAGSFGQRPLIPSYAFLSLPLGLFIQRAFYTKKTLPKAAAALFLTACAALNIFRTIQFDKGIIDDQRMTKAYYFSTFGQLSVPTPEQRKLLLVQRSVSLNDSLSNEEREALEPGKKISLSFTKQKNKFYTDSLNAPEKYALLVSAGNDSSEIITAPYNELTQKNYAWIKATLQVYIPAQDTNKNSARIEVMFTHKGWPYKLRRIPLSNYRIPFNEWKEIMLFYQTPEVRSKNDKLRFYLYNPGSCKVYLGSIRIECLEPKENKGFF
jgi:hypothetical protein